MGIYGEISKRLVRSQQILDGNLEIVNEVCFTTKSDPLKIDSYQPETFKASMIGSPKGAYMEIYDKPDFSKATKVLRVNVCFGWIITNHSAKQGKVSWVNVDKNTMKLINSLLDRVGPTGNTMYVDILKFYNLPLDWPKPNFTKMIPEPDDNVKDNLERAAYRKMEIARKEKEEKERKEALRKKYYGNY